MPEALSDLSVIQWRRDGKPEQISLTNLNRDWREEDRQVLSPRLVGKNRAQDTASTPLVYPA